MENIKSEEMSSSCAESELQLDMGTAKFSSVFLLCAFLCGVYSSEFPDSTYVEPEHLGNLFASGQYEELARLLGIDNVNLVKPAEGNRSVDPMFNEGLDGGDILLTSSQREEARQGINFGRNPNSKWNREIPFSIDGKSYNSQQRLTIMQAIMKWNMDFFRNIRFVPRRNQKDYVWFFSGNGCYSYVGKIGGQQALSLQSNGCVGRGAILHEMSHAAGIIHEHNRPDRDQYVRILNENIPPEWRSQYEKSSSDGIKILGPYDYYSVMHYPYLAPGTNKPAFQILKPNVDTSKIGNRNEQSQIDKDKIRKLYS